MPFRSLNWLRRRMRRPDTSALDTALSAFNAVNGSAATLVSALAKVISNASSDPDRLQEFADTLVANSDALTQAVENNTDTEQPMPEPLPEIDLARIRSMSISDETQDIEVTTYGDPDPQYIRGPLRIRISLSTWQIDVPITSDVLLLGQRCRVTFIDLSADVGEPAYAELDIEPVGEMSPIWLSTLRLSLTMQHLGTSAASAAAAMQDVGTTFTQIADATQPGSLDVTYASGTLDLDGATYAHLGNGIIFHAGGSDPAGTIVLGPNGNPIGLSLGNGTVQTQGVADAQVGQVVNAPGLPFVRVRAPRVIRGGKVVRTKPLRVQPEPEPTLRPKGRKIVLED